MKKHTVGFKEMGCKVYLGEHWKLARLRGKQRLKQRLIVDKFEFSSIDEILKFFKAESFRYTSVSINQYRDRLKEKFYWQWDCLFYIFCERDEDYLIFAVQGKPLRVYQVRKEAFDYASKYVLETGELICYLCEDVFDDEDELSDHIELCEEDM